MSELDRAIHEATGKHPENPDLSAYTIYDARDDILGLLPHLPEFPDMDTVVELSGPDSYHVLDTPPTAADLRMHLVQGHHGSPEIQLTEFPGGQIGLGIGEMGTGLVGGNLEWAILQNDSRNMHSHPGNGNAFLYSHPSVRDLGNDIAPANVRGIISEAGFSSFTTIEDDPTVLWADYVAETRRNHQGEFLDQEELFRQFVHEVVAPLHIPWHEVDPTTPITELHDLAKATGKPLRKGAS